MWRNDSSPGLDERRHLFPITRAAVIRREARLVALEGAAIRLARDAARTDEERALMDDEGLRT